MEMDLTKEDFEAIKMHSMKRFIEKQGCSVTFLDDGFVEIASPTRLTEKQSLIFWCEDFTDPVSLSREMSNKLRAFCPEKESLRYAEKKGYGLRFEKGTVIDLYKDFELWKTDMFHLVDAIVKVSIS